MTLRLTAALASVFVVAAADVATAQVAVPAVEAAATPIEHPWTIPSDMPVERRSIVFASGEARLSGTLFIPRDAPPRATVIALHGAQAPLRSHPLYRHMIEIMPRLGIAVFVYDRRGSGESTDGGVSEGDFDLLASDAVAAFARLRDEPGLDRDSIGFWGLSQGGWLTLSAADKEPRAAFAVAVSAPMAAADVQMNFAVANILRVRGQPQSVIDRAIRARTAVDDYAKGLLSRAEAERAEAEVADEPWYDQLWLDGNIDDPAWPIQLRADPLRELTRSRVPTLVVFGQSDPWVPVETSVAALRARADDLPHVTLRIIDGADHAMMLDVPALQQMDTESAIQGAPDAPAYFALLASWLEQRLPARPSGL